MHTAAQDIGYAPDGFVLGLSHESVVAGRKSVVLCRFDQGAFGGVAKIRNSVA